MLNASSQSEKKRGAVPLDSHSEGRWSIPCSCGISNINTAVSLNSHLPECVCLGENVTENAQGGSSVKNLKNQKYLTLLCVSSCFLFSRSYKQMEQICVLRNTKMASRRSLKWAGWSGPVKRNPLTCIFILYSPVLLIFDVFFFLQPCLQPDNNFKTCLCCTGRTNCLLSVSHSGECCEVIIGWDLKTHRWCF